MRRVVAIALRTTAVTLILTGLAYPLAVTAIAQLFFPWRADGSLVRDDRGVVVGSALIGQPFTNAAYFQPRPSAAGAGYDGAASGGSNLGPTSRRLRARVTGDLRRLLLQNPGAREPLPADLVTTSGSGLDPHLSPEATLWQVPRIARVRTVAPERIAEVVRRHIEGRDLGFLGERRVNVLTLNLALDRQLGAPPEEHRAAGPP